MRRPLAGAALAAGVALAGLTQQLSNRLIFPFQHCAGTTPERALPCTPWLQNVAYANLQDGTHGAPLELACEEAAAWPGVDLFTPSGIHLKLYDTALPPQSPLFLHVHGVTGNVLHGARYLKMATRLGFTLAVMELSNHGASTHNGLGAAYGCREHEDVAATLTLLRRHFPRRRVLLHATSMGTMAAAGALALGQSSNVDALVLESPISQLEDVLTLGVNVPWIPAWLRFLVLGVSSARVKCDLQKETPLHWLPQVHVPTLVLHTTQDDLVPLTMAQRVLGALTAAPYQRMTVYPRGAHSAVWNGQPAQYEQELAQLWTHAAPR